MKELDDKIKDDEEEISLQEIEEGTHQQREDDFSDWKKKATLFLSGQAVSLFGSSLVQFAIIWHITLTTQSGPMMTISTICGFLPQIAISLFAGVWADRYNRRLLIIFADILIALPTLILAVLFMLGYRELWLLFLISGIRSIGSGIQSPAIGALLPQIVPQEKLAKVNGINGSIQSTILLISPIASGTLMSLSTLENIFFIDVATAMIAVGIMMTLKVSLHKKAAQKQESGYFDDLKEGLRYARQNVFIRTLLMFYSLFFFLLTPVAMLTPLMIARSFGEEVWRLTFNEVAFFGGSIIGGIIFAAWGGFKNHVHTLALACTAFGVLTAILGFSSVFVIYLIVMFVTGIFMPFFHSPVTVLLQERVDQDMLGRIFSIIQIVASTAFPLGMVVFGPIAEVIKVEMLLIITGVLMAIQGVNIFYNKGFKSVN
jgi:MFS transporter, DHA3 family, macrolide efflux protein